ncbi:hypothetical protein NMY22_g2965 [Coprinellus aureogranulatus]|nr:hypothetical protein NMY22_g2965 [Coprinellus aureogranulatus]
MSGSICQCARRCLETQPKKAAILAGFLTRIYSLSSCPSRTFELGMYCLITGGASQTGTTVAKYLKQAGMDVVFASRSRVPGGLYYSWRLSLCTPGRYGRREGQRAWTGKVHRYLEEKGVDYFVPQPTWFMGMPLYSSFEVNPAIDPPRLSDNFVEFHSRSIGERDEFKTVMPNAKIPLISVENIGRFAAQVLLNGKNGRSEQRIVGPELLTYDQAVDILSGVVGRRISHSVVSREELMAYYIETCGYPPEYANFVITAEMENDRGAQEKWWGHPDNLVGTETLRAWATSHVGQQLGLPRPTILNLQRDGPVAHSFFVRHSSFIFNYAWPKGHLTFRSFISPLRPRYALRTSSAGENHRRNLNGCLTNFVSRDHVTSHRQRTLHWDTEVILGRYQQSPPYQSLSLTLSHFSSEMSILITGGNSQTGLATAKYLKEAGKRPVIASRQGVTSNGFDAVKLDWSDPSTLEAPFADGQTYEGVYLLSPMTLAGVVDVTPAIINFINIAAARGVKRFVFISGCMVDKNGDHGHAKIHKHLEAKNVDHLVLKPPMFMDNLLVIYAKSIRDNDEIVSDTPNAKFPMISVEDIGRLAAKAFLNEKNEHTEQYMVGPELLTLDQAAEILSDVLGRKITHRVVKPDEMVEFYMSIGPELGWSREMAQFVVMAEALIDAGAQEKIVAYPNNLVGEETFRQWVERFKHVFTRSG